MRILRQALIVFAAIAPFAFAGVAAAAPAVCSVGNADSTCMKGAVISAAVQTPPTICTGAGETVQSAPRWTGSVYTSGSCNYTPPPQCPPNTVQQGTLAWSGSEWVGSNCIPSWANQTGWTPPGSPLGNCELAIYEAQPTGAWQPYTPMSSQTTGGFIYTPPGATNFWYQWVAYGLQGTYFPVAYDTYFEMYQPTSNYEMYNYIGGDYQVLGMVLAGASPEMWSCDVTPAGVVQSVVPFGPVEAGCAVDGATANCGGGGYGN
jgi:hypothetical protein